MNVPTTGLELELWAVDDRGRLTDGHPIAAAHDRIEREFVGPLLEVKTEPQDTVAGLERDLREVLRTAIAAAADRDSHLVPLGTPLTRLERPARTARGRLFERLYGDGVRSAKNCAGTHVHFETGDVRRQLNLLTALDPALALVSSSPYYCGRRDAASSRALAYRTRCGPEFEHFCDLWPYAGSVEGWTARVDDAYRSFVSIAQRRGVSRHAVARHFSPEDAVLNPVRLRRRQSTVEWRAPDAALPSQVLRLARDVGRLVARTDSTRLEYGAAGAYEDRICVPSFDRARELGRAAIHSGLDSGRVRSYLARLGFDTSAYDPIGREIGGRGRLSRSAARDIRLEYAERLREDVEGLSAGAAGEPDATLEFQSA